MGKCRDCRICTRTGIMKLICFFGRVPMEVLFRWNVGLFRRRCPICGHLLKHHERRADGSFMD